MPTMPAEEPTMKSLQQQIADLKKELRSMRRKQQEEPVQQAKEDRIVYSHPLAPEAGVVSPPYRYRRPSGYLTSIEVSAGTPATDDPTVVRAYRKAIGGSKIKTLGVATLLKEDDYEIADDLMGEVDELDRIFVVCDSVGTGVADLTITLTFIESVE